MAQGINSVVNFLGPAVGTMSGYMIHQVFGATPSFFDFNRVGLDGKDFRPSGLYADNTQGTADLVVLINEMSLRFVVPAGGYLQTPFPAPLGVTANISGDGTNECTVVFVDYPVMPFKSW